MNQSTGVTPASPAGEGVEAGSPPALDVQRASPAEGQSVPYDRFQKVNQEKNDYKEQIDSQNQQMTDMSSRLDEITKNPASLFQQQQQGSQIPDMYSDPEGFQKHVIDQAVNAVKKESVDSAAKLKEEEDYIESQFGQLHKDNDEIDEVVISKFAQDHGIIDAKTGRYNLVKAHELMLSMNPQKLNAPVSTRSGNAVGVQPNVSMEQFSNMGSENWAAYLASK